VAVDFRQMFSVREFLRDQKQLSTKVTETWKTMDWTVRGRTALVNQDAGSYQQLVAELEPAGIGDREQE
jgi:hypothetical protein